jgi:WD40 repeat protein
MTPLSSLGMYELGGKYASLKDIPCRATAFSPDGQTFASGDYRATIQLWDIRTEQQILTLNGHSQPVYTIAFSPDGQTLASGSGDKTIKLWDIGRRLENYTLKGHSRWVNSVAFDLDGQILVSGSGDKTIKIWRVKAISTSY